MPEKIRLIHTLKGWIFYLILAVTLIPIAAAVIICAPFSSNTSFSIAKWWAQFMLNVAKGVCGLNWQEKGFEHFPSDGSAVLVMSKHQSAWEAFWMFARLPAKMSFVYKRELHFIPVFGQALATLGMTAINRSKGGKAFEQFLYQGKRAIEKGRWIVLFPEGTRTLPGTVNHYKTGGARFAEQTGVPIIPVALDSGRFWPRNAIGKRPGTITVSIGPKIETAGRTFEAIQNDLVTWIEAEMRVISPESYS